MPFKINISQQGKTYKLETESEILIGRRIGETVKGEDISHELAGYELKITGTSDKAGFPGKKDVEGTMLKKLLLTKGFALKRKPKKEGKKQVGRKMPKGLRMRKTVRGNTISLDTVQINTKVTKSGAKKLDEIFPSEPKEGKEAEQEEKELNDKKNKEQTKKEKA